MRCSDRAATEFAFRQSIQAPATRVRHRLTQAEGRVTAIRLQLHPGDTVGPWVQVDFDDGLHCWVPEVNVEVVG